MMWHIEIEGVKHEFYTTSSQNIISFENSFIWFFTCHGNEI